MTGILHDQIPADGTAHPLPGTRPCAPGDWLRRDERFAQQMAERDRLVRDHRAEVIDQRPEAAPALEELLNAVRIELGALSDTYARPDGESVPIDTTDPLGTLGRLCQEDFAILLDGGDEHWLAGGVVCFPSRWTLAEKLGRPLTSIHIPVAAYDAAIAARVQRLFHGVQPGRPLVRWNHIPYDSDVLFNPAPEDSARIAHADRGPQPYLRKERQVILRLPETQAVVFSIHTYVVRSAP